MTHLTSSVPFRYDCQGRCGAGCDGLSHGNAYTLECWSHDICSYFYNATDGLEDPNCGRAFLNAMEGFVIGVDVGCARENPDPPLKPINVTDKPTCIKKTSMVGVL